jgi:hypothetical protein
MPMKRIWGFVFGGVVVASVGGLSLSACAHDDSTIYVQSVLAPPLVAPGTAECLYTADPTQAALSSGKLDIALRNTYDAAFLLANQIVARGDPTAPQTETSIVNIKGAVVRITDSNGMVLNSYTRTATAVIAPAQGSTPGYAALAPLTIIDQGTVAGLGNLAFGDVRRLVVFTKFYGDTLGGQYVESDDFQFPVDVCNQCLISFSVSDIDMNCENLNCLGNAGATTQSPTVPCDLEDFLVDCQACLDSPVCNPPCVKKPGVDVADAGGE